MNRLDFRYSCGNVTVAFTDVALTTGIERLQLGFQASISAAWLDGETAVTPLLVTGRLHTDLYEAAPIAEVAPRVLILRSYAVSEQFVVTLTDEQVLALEQRRQGGDVRFYLKLQATLLSPLPSIHPYVEGELALKVPASDWIAALSADRRMFGLIILVPAPLLSPRDQPEATIASRSQALSRLRDARAELADGRYEPCVATCRKVLETLKRLDNPPTAKAIGAIPSEQRSEIQRWGALFHALQSLTSAAHHDDEVTVQFTWRRADAEAVLAMVASLCARSFD